MALIAFLMVARALLHGSSLPELPFCPLGQLQERRINNGKHLCFWDKSRSGKLIRLWNEGCPIKEIARECGANPDVTKNRISYEIKCGRIKTRKRTLTDDEREKICKMRDSGMKIQMIAKDMKCSTKTVMNILKERGKK